MKAIQIFIVFLLLLQVASAHEAYTCKPMNWPTRIRLMLDKDLGMKKGKLAVDSESCTLTQHDRYTEICAIGNNTLMISGTDAPSVLVLKNGNIYKMDCGGDAAPQSQQQEQGEGPGHGGNTMGGGHGKKTISGHE